MKSPVQSAGNGQVWKHEQYYAGIQFSIIFHLQLKVSKPALKDNFLLRSSYFVEEVTFVKNFSAM
jgi:hypothetical protein